MREGFSGIARCSDVCLRKSFELCPNGCARESSRGRQEKCRRCSVALAPYAPRGRHSRLHDASRDAASSRSNIITRASQVGTYPSMGRGPAGKSTQDPKQSGTVVLGLAGGLFRRSIRRAQTTELARTGFSLSVVTLPTLYSMQLRQHCNLVGSHWVVGLDTASQSHPSFVLA